MVEQSTEYTIATEPDGDTRFFDSLADARDFVEENHDRIRGQVEKRVWDHSNCTEEIHDCKADNQKTKLVTIDEFMEAREVSL